MLWCPRDDGRIFPRDDGSPAKHDMFREDPPVGVEKDRIPLWANDEPKLHYEMFGRPLSREQLAMMVAADPPGTSNLLARGVIQRLVCLHGGAPPEQLRERLFPGQPEEKSDDADSDGIALGVVARRLSRHLSQTFIGSAEEPEGTLKLVGSVTEPDETLTLIMKCISELVDAPGFDPACEHEALKNLRESLSNLGNRLDDPAEQGLLAESLRLVLQLPPDEFSGFLSKILASTLSRAAGVAIDEELVKNCTHELSEVVDVDDLIKLAQTPAHAIALVMELGDIGLEVLRVMCTTKLHDVLIKQHFEQSDVQVRVAPSTPGDANPDSAGPSFDPVFEAVTGATVLVACEFEQHNEFITNMSLFPCT